MAEPPCEECKAIFQELLDIMQDAWRDKPGRATSQQLYEWFEQQSADDGRRMRLRSAVSQATRRIIDHRNRTGHNVPTPLPPGGLTSWN
jgi:hypothetical protein